MTLNEAEFLCDQRRIADVYLGSLEETLTPKKVAEAPKVLMRVFNHPGKHAFFYTNRVEILWALQDAGLVFVRRHRGAKLYYINNDRKASK